MRMVIVTVSLAVYLLAGPVPGLTHAAGTIYTDDFSGDLGNWTAGPSHLDDYGIVNSELYLDGNGYLTGSHGWGVLQFNQELGSRFIASWDARIVSDDYACIVLFADAPYAFNAGNGREENGYHMWLDINDLVTPQFDATKGVAGVTSDLAVPQKNIPVAPDIPRDQWFNLRTEYDHGTLRIYIDNVLYVDTYDPTFSNSTFKIGVSLGEDSRGYIDNFSVEVLPPPCPSPCGGEVAATRRPTFSWCPATDATWYQLLALRDGKPLVRQWVNATTTWTPDFDLLSGNYCWWVRPWGPVTGMGNWSTGCCFSVEACAVAAVSGLSPDGDCLTGNPLTLSWDADPCATHYQVWVKRGGKGWFKRWFETGQVSGTVAQTLPAAAPFGTNRWWVRGWNVDGLGAWSDSALFEVGKPVPTEPSGAVASPVTFSVDDTCSARAEWYQVLVQRDGRDVFRQWIKKSDMMDCGANSRCYGPVALPQGDYTYWFRTWAPGGMSSWSDEVTFSIQ